MMVREWDWALAERDRKREVPEILVLAGLLA